MSELDKLISKAKMIGVDATALIEELVALVSARVQINTKQLAEDIAKAMPIPTVDVAEVAAQLRGMLPESAGPALDLVQLKAELETGLWTKLEGELNGIAGTLKERLEVIRKETREGLDAAIELKLVAVKDQLVAAVRSAIPELQPGGDGGKNAPGDMRGMAFDLLSKFLDRQDSLSLDNLDKLHGMYQKLNGLFGHGGGPDANLQFKTVSEAYLEGRKHQHQWDMEEMRGGKAVTRPFPSARNAGRSATQTSKFSRIDNAIRGL